MNNYIEILKQSSLFFGLNKDEITALLECTHARYKSFDKGEIIIEEGSEVSAFGILLSGRAHSLKNDINGKSFIVTVIEPSGFFGVLLASSRKHKSPVSVQAQEPLAALMIPAENIVTRCSANCKKHDILLLNFINSLAEMALLLHDRNDCLIKTRVREKILTYLVRASKLKGGNTFSIPLDRAAMAEYLNVERSALSRELSRMKHDGIIDFHKSSFRLLYKQNKTDCHYKHSAEKSVY